MYTKVGHELDTSMDWIGLNSERHFLDWIGPPIFLILMLSSVIAGLVR